MTTPKNAKSAAESCTRVEEYGPNQPSIKECAQAFAAKLKDGGYYYCRIKTYPKDEKNKTIVFDNGFHHRTFTQDELIAASIVECLYFDPIPLGAEGGVNKAGDEEVKPLHTQISQILEQAQYDIFQGAPQSFKTFAGMDNFGDVNINTDGIAFCVGDDHFNKKQLTEVRDYINTIIEKYF